MPLSDDVRNGVRDCVRTPEATVDIGELNLASRDHLDRKSENLLRAQRLSPLLI